MKLPRVFWSSMPKIGIYLLQAFSTTRWTDVSNYGHVTLLLTISKILKRQVAERVIKHLTERILPYHACLWNLLPMDDWTQAVGKDASTHACHLDFPKSSDRDNDSIILQNVKQYGITG